MEGGSALGTYLMYALLWALVLVMLYYVFRSARFFVSLLLIPMAQLLSFIPPVRRWLEAWGQRGEKY